MTTGYSAPAGSTALSPEQEFSDPSIPQYSAEGGDWQQIVEAQHRDRADRMIINMGPAHPSTHGVMRLCLEMDGDIVTNLRPAIGYLHTGIEKTAEYRTWTQGSALVTRMDYVAPMFNECVYSMAVEKVMGITDDIPERAQIIRVLCLELCRIASHLVALATGGNELGGTTLLTNGLRERERILDFFECISGLRMNHAYIRPGGVAGDLPENGMKILDTCLDWLEKRMPDFSKMLNDNPVFKKRFVDVAYLDLTGCMALGITGPRLRAAGLQWDLRKAEPCLGYETYDFDVPVWHTCDAYGAYRVRLAEMFESLKIARQCRDRLAQTEGQPFMVKDPKIARPAYLKVYKDGQGNSYEHVKNIMGQDMESLIHHFKLVTEGFKVPAGQAYVELESPKGIIGCHVVSDGGTHPYRVHMRDPAFHAIQALPALCEGGTLSDVVVAISSIDPVLGGVDR
ncbi:NADH-quinone oxidoreductase subunit D [Corynebacterium glucuronolyticum]|uniref:NADH-quinone oxidoreductase subunit D n=1 Tax=Corynebacterium glucuronolyticum TaxID=39791 RepID=UPI00191ED43D|nr:NADH-quinone oxidoreductase subunit D [Corynebacterium glucuronolyticum]QQU89414.1 NADH-quinone oxidoreductase subunit D [Corynebacterium glucuronolyticum]